MTHEPVTFIGETTHRYRPSRFGIKKSDRCYHMLLVGKTGVGKSTLLETLMASDASQGEGFALIDPHGDLAERVLKHIPKERQKDVLYFDPSDKEHPLAFNILDNPDIEPALVISGVIAVFKKIWDESWGPRLEYILMNSLWSLITTNGTTLADVPRILVDKEFRKAILQNVTDRQILDFWAKEYDRYSEAFRQVAIAPILNKLGQFLLNPYSRAVLAQPRSELDIRKVMDEGKILIANLAKGRIGEDGSSLLGSLLLTQIELAAMTRANIPEAERRDFYLYVDEFPTVATEQATTIMAESRKYRLCLIVAMQYVEQLEKELRDAVFENVGTQIAFRCGPGSARHLAQEFKPDFEDVDFLEVPRYHVVLRLVIEGVSSKPFTARTFAVDERRGC